MEITQELPRPTHVRPPARDFRLGPYDNIVIDVLGAAELRREGRIDGSGNFNLPLIGSVQAAGRTPAELASSIGDLLRGRYIRNPQVSVSVREIASQEFSIDGEVRQPGRYAAAGDITLQVAIASARGITEEAQMSEVVVFRTIEGRQMAALYSLRDIREGRAVDPDIYTGDIIIVGTSRSRRLFRDLAQIAPIFSVFTPLVYGLNNN
ncbi:MAG: polysaccharide biosynthesis/export family protein [Sphingosinicella sp.]|uniref:polysaccharide biosynthesis/export family protein n=1 Tax=Sphingosinicella sp. TaxID=1917971 RepID=UPI0040376CA8